MCTPGVEQPDALKQLTRDQQPSILGYGEIQILLSLPLRKAHFSQDLTQLVRAGNQFLIASCLARSPASMRCAASRGAIVSAWGAGRLASPTICSFTSNSDLMKRNDTPGRFGSAGVLVRPPF